MSTIYNFPRRRVAAVAQRLGASRSGAPVAPASAAMMSRPSSGWATSEPSGARTPLLLRRRERSGRARPPRSGIGRRQSGCPRTALSGMCARSRGRARAAVAVGARHAPWRSFSLSSASRHRSAPARPPASPDGVPRLVGAWSSSDHRPLWWRFRRPEPPRPRRRGASARRAFGERPVLANSSLSDSPLAIPCTSSACSGPTKVTPTPRRPARPVRPTRCT
jgi:hypothetical protein